MRQYSFLGGDGLPARTEKRTFRDGLYQVGKKVLEKVLTELTVKYLIYFLIPLAALFLPGFRKILLSNVCLAFWQLILISIVPFLVSLLIFRLKNEKKILHKGLELRWSRRWLTREVVSVRVCCPKDKVELVESKKKAGEKLRWATKEMVPKYERSYRCVICEEHFSYLSQDEALKLVRSHEMR